MNPSPTIDCHYPPETSDTLLRYLTDLRARTVSTREALNGDDAPHQVVGLADSLIRQLREHEAERQPWPDSTDTKPRIRRTKTFREVGPTPREHLWTFKIGKLDDQRRVGNDDPLHRALTACWKAIDLAWIEDEIDWRRIHTQLITIGLLLHLEVE